MKRQHEVEVEEEETRIVGRKEKKKSSGTSGWEGNGVFRCGRDDEGTEREFW